MTANELPRGRARTIAELASIGWTIARTCQELGVSEATVGRARRAHAGWIVERRDALADDASAQLLGLVPRAIDRLGQLVDSRNDAVSLGASKYVIEQTLRWRDALVIESRLAALEAAADVDGARDEWL